jgi:hypothetical protein
LPLRYGSQAAGTTPHSQKGEEAATPWCRYELGRRSEAADRKLGQRSPG